MDQEKQSLFQRIRNARKSLENAEKSFQDDRGIRGELDLMLAEAELKNLRNKKGFSLSWNRQLLALSVALLLVVAGVVGWFCAKEDMHNPEVVPAVTNSQPLPNDAKATNINKPNLDEAGKYTADKTTEGDKKTPGIQLSNQDMHRLVRSAKSELSSGK